MKSRTLILFSLLCTLIFALTPIGCTSGSKKSGISGTLTKVYIDATASTQYNSDTRTLRVPKGYTTNSNILYELAVRGADANSNDVSLTSGHTFLWVITGNSNLAFDTSDSNFNGDDRMVRVKCLGDLNDNGGTDPQATITVIVITNDGTAVWNPADQNVTVQGIINMEKPNSNFWGYTTPAGVKVSTVEALTNERPVYGVYHEASWEGVVSQWELIVAGKTVGMVGLMVRVWESGYRQQRWVAKDISSTNVKRFEFDLWNCSIPKFFRWTVESLKKDQNFPPGFYAGREVEKDPKTGETRRLEGTLQQPSSKEVLKWSLTRHEEEKK